MSQAGSLFRMQILCFVAKFYNAATAAAIVSPIGVLSTSSAERSARVSV